MDDRFEPYRDALKQGHVAAGRGRYKDALRHYQQAARLADERAQPHVSIGAVLLKMGKHKDAVAAYERARQRAPQDSQVLRGLAHALGAAGRNDEARAIEDQLAQLEQAAPAPQVGPGAAALGGAEMLHLAGHQAWLDGRAEAAIDAWLDEARSHAANGHLDAALDACQQALTASPGALRIHLEMCRLYFRRGWNDRAVDLLVLLDRLLGLEPDAQVAQQVGSLAAEHVSRDVRLVPLARGLGHSGTPPTG